MNEIDSLRKRVEVLYHENEGNKKEVARLTKELQDEKEKHRFDVERADNRYYSVCERAMELYLTDNSVHNKIQLTVEIPKAFFTAQTLTDGFYRKLETMLKAEAIRKEVF